MNQERSFGDWLRLRRKALDLTQAELAQQVGCSAATIRKIEAGERRPSAQIAGILAQVFSIPENERAAFLLFARSGWGLAPVEEPKDIPWRASGDPTPSNLPAPTTGIIGRAREIARLRDQLLNPAIRLVTLIGPPGIGKTRLSQEVGRELRQHFPDGVFFVTLAPFDHPDLIAPTIAQTLGFEEVKGQNQVERLKDGIGGKFLLLVLDNLEHLISPAASLVGDLLSACPGLKILATSREALRLSGEWLFPVPALEFPDMASEQAVDIDIISRFPALVLFEERARAVRPDFVLDGDNFGAVSAICQRVDGLPLAIELVSARLRLMSPQTLLMRLSDVLALQTAGLRALPDRQKTLHNAIGWSYDLLSVEEKRLFSRLSVFSGSFTLQAVEQAFSSVFLQESATELVASLLDKSLLQRAVDEQGEPRFSLLATIQQFALERLRERGEEGAMRDLQLAYFLELAEQADQEMHGPDQIKWIAQLEAEQDNFRAALEWCISEQDTSGALRLLGALSWPWWLRGRSNEVRAWFAKCNALDRVTEYPALYARLLNHLGRQNWILGDFPSAQCLLEQSRAIWLELGVEGEKGLAEALLYLGMVARFYKNDYATAQRYLEQGFELCQNSDHQWLKGLVMVNLGRFAMDQGQGALAVTWLEQGLSLFFELGDRWGISRASQILGELNMNQGNYKKAQEFFEQHLRGDEELHFNQGVVVALGNLGELYCYQGDYARAELFLQKSLLMSREFDYKWDISYIYRMQGILDLQRNNYQSARQHFINSYDLARKLLAAEISAFHLLVGLAAVAAGQNQPERAARLSGAAGTILEALDIHYLTFERAVLDQHIGLARQQLGDTRYEVLAAEGRAMTLEQAVAEALEGGTEAS